MSVGVIHPRTPLQIAWVNSKAHQPFLDFEHLFVLDFIKEGDWRHIDAGRFNIADDDDKKKLALLCDTRIHTVIKMEQKFPLLTIFDFRSYVEIMFYLYLWIEQLKDSPKTVGSCDPPGLITSIPSQL